MNKCEVCGKQLKTNRRRICDVCGVKTRRYRIKKMAVAYKGGKCEKCGFDGNIASLQFHHIDQKNKEFVISSTHNKAWINIKKELDKCQLLCANCHMALHAEKSIEFYNRANTYYGQPLSLKLFEEYQNGFSKSKFMAKGVSSEIEIGLEHSYGICKQCGNPVTGFSESGLCRKCWNFNRRVSQRPSKEILLDLIKKSGYSAVGRMYGVSDNAIRKWLK